MRVRNLYSAPFVCFLFATVATAQQSASTSRPYDGIQAGLDAFRMAEEKRQGAVSQQLFLNDQMRFWNGYPTSRGETIYYGYLSPAAMWAYGFGPPAVAAAWPYGPGDFWGYGAYYQPARQPIGQHQSQTGPNRWESHPVYDPPLTPYQPLPPVDSPLLDRTPFATANATLPPSEVIPPPPPRTINAARPDISAPNAPAVPAPRRVPREY